VFFVNVDDSKNLLYKRPLLKVLWANKVVRNSANKQSQEP